MRRLHFKYYSCDFLVYRRNVFSYNGVELIKAVVYSDSQLIFHIVRKREPFRLFE